MSEFDHWYTKEHYEALERKAKNKINGLEIKITAIKDVIEGVPERRPNQYAALQNLGIQGGLGLQQQSCRPSVLDGLLGNLLR